MRFPLPYKEAIKKCSLTHEQIAKLLKIGKHRWNNIYYGHAKMDVKEYNDIKYLVESLTRGKI